MSKYIIEIPDDVQYVLLNGQTDNKCYTAVRPVAELEVLNSDYINEHYGELQDEAYQQGLNDAWEAMKKIALSSEDGALTTHQLKEIFGTYFVSEIIRERTAQEVIDKIKAYEDKRSDRIEVGDEVEWDGDCFIVTKIFQPRNMKEQCDGIDDDGSAYHDILMEDLKKTGKHYDIASILEAMRTHD